MSIDEISVKIGTWKSGGYFRPEPNLEPHINYIKIFF